MLGVVCLVIFLRRQRRLESGPGPLLDLRAFRYPMFRLSLALLCIAMAALFSLIILLPLYLQNIRGLGTLQTGLLLLPGGLLMGLLGPIVGRLFDRFGPRVLTVPGRLRPGAVHVRLQPGRGRHAGDHAARACTSCSPPGSPSC